MKLKTVNEYGDRTQKSYKIIGGNQIGIHFLFFILILLYSASISGQKQSYLENTNQNLTLQNDSIKTNNKNFFKQDYITGDWWGGRSYLGNRGLNFDFRYSSTYQGLMAGTGEKEFDYGGKVDAFINLETEKMRLWRGGGFNVHLEYAHGALNPNIGGVLFPENIAQLYPVSSKEMIVGTSLYFTQNIGSQFKMALGKINPIDLLAPDLFSGGWGVDRFMNLIFVGPPSGLVPPILAGGVFKYKTQPLNYTLMVYDPDDRTNDYFPGDWFSSGMNFSFKVSHPNKIAGRTTSYSITANYSTAESTDYSYLQPDIEQQVTKKGSYNISFEFIHNLEESAADYNSAWAIYFKGAVADGNPNYVKASLITGIAGRPLFFNRPQDSFGVGYFYYNLSNVLEDALTTAASITDESGLEMFYSYSITSWFYIGADIQYIRPFQETYNNALVGAIRTQIRI